MKVLARLIGYCVLLSCLGCTTIPSSYTKGDKEIWPRWGYRISNESPEGFDLEIIFQQYVMFCTAGDGQIERARSVFLACAKAEAGKRAKAMVDVPQVELEASHVRNTIDGVCSVRVGKRLQFQR